jgi:sorting nexin-8
VSELRQREPTRRRADSSWLSHRDHTPVSTRIEMASWGSTRQDSLPPAYGRQASWSASDGWGTNDAAAPPPPTISATAGYSFDNATGAGPTATPAPAARPRAATNASGFADAAAVEGDDWELPPLERVQVVLKGDMQGWAFVKHHVWTVVHPDKGTSVERRYSDFVWLVESLTKRYPFRLLPALPPKRIQVSGHYLATDELFLERRRRGLERALTALMAHPVLKRDALLNAFMTEQRVRARPRLLSANVRADKTNEINNVQDLSEYRKSQEISLAEESSSRTLTPTELASLPTDLETRLTSVRQRVIPLVESWTRITSTADKIAHRRQNQGREYASFRDALENAVETCQGAWRPNEVGQVERHIRSVASLASEVAETNETSAQRSLDTVVESLKQVRGAWRYSSSLNISYSAHTSLADPRSIARSLSTCAICLVDKSHLAAIKSKSFGNGSTETPTRYARLEATEPLEALQAKS